MNGILKFITKPFRWFSRHGESRAGAVSSNTASAYSLRDVVAEATAPLIVAAGETGIDMVVNVRDSVPDLFSGSPDGVKKVIVKQVTSAMQSIDSGYLRVDVSCIIRSDGRPKLRFRTSTSRKHRPDVGFMKPSRVERRVDW